MSHPVQRPNKIIKMSTKMTTNVPSSTSSSVLPTSSSFLPVLDDLLSPDYRPGATPLGMAQTPQTPSSLLQTPIDPSYKPMENHTGQLTQKLMTSSTYMMMSSSCSSSSNAVVVGTEQTKDQVDDDGGAKVRTNATRKIQRWWRRRYDNRMRDPVAEGAMHSIRHGRTEDHIRYLESEVVRLKGALATEKKLRCLQVDAIKSLWIQVRSNNNNSAQQDNSNVMSQSMPPPNPNAPASGLAIKNPMTTSLMVGGSCKGDGGVSSTTCSSCSLEIAAVRKEFMQEIEQLKKMFLSSPKQVGGGRPATLDLVGGEHKDGNKLKGFANELATSIIGDIGENQEDVN